MNSSGSENCPGLGSNEHGNELCFQYGREIYWPAEQLLISQKGLCSMGLIFNGLHSRLGAPATQNKYFFCSKHQSIEAS